MARRVHSGSALKEIIMKASKFIVLVGGILGILAFFLPMVTVQQQDFSGSVSAFQIIKGLDAVSVAAGSTEASVALASAGTSSQSAKDALDGMKAIVMAIFVPALMLVLIGGLGVYRKKFGRVAGTFSLLFGLLGLGIGAMLKSAAEGDSGIGLTLLLVTGVAGIVGGLITLVKPERPVIPAKDQPKLVAFAA
jgi:hypothetical protein